MMNHITLPASSYSCMSEDLFDSLLNNMILVQAFADCEFMAAAGAAVISAASLSPAEGTG